MLEVTVRQRQCVGNGCCAEIAPEVFVMGDDGVAYVLEDGRVQPWGATALVPEHLGEVVAEAAEECPAECIRVACAALPAAPRARAPA
jgi:ferredoxin